MAVVPRKRKRGLVYYVATSWEGGQHWELVGKNKREAEQLDSQRKREVKDRSFRPGRVTDAASVETFALGWLKTRKNRAADNDRLLIERHVLAVRWFAELRMSDVRPRHVIKLIDALREAGKLAEKTIALALGLVRVMFRDAVIDETLSATPYVVPRDKLTREGETREPYTIEEARALTSDAVAERDRMWTLLAFYTGARCGEICGLRWSDWDLSPAPLSSLKVERQYDGEDGNAKTKTKRGRVVPVHPRLAAELETWRARWAVHFLRRPLPSDPIVPGPGAEPMTKSSAYKGWRRACVAAGVTNRSVHSTRHTFITLTQRFGAPEKTVLRITHNPKGTIIDTYNHRDWSEFCSAVLCLPFDVSLDADDANGGNEGSSSRTRSWDNRGKPRRSPKGEVSDGPEEPPKASGVSLRGALLDAGQDDPEALDFAFAVAEQLERARAFSLLAGAATGAAS